MPAGWPRGGGSSGARPRTSPAWTPTACGRPGRRLSPARGRTVTKRSQGSLAVVVVAQEPAQVRDIGAPLLDEGHMGAVLEHAELSVGQLAGDAPHPLRRGLVVPARGHE